MSPGRVLKVRDNFSDVWMAFDKAASAARRADRIARKLPGQIHCHPIQLDDRVWRQAERRGRTTRRAKGVPTMVELVYTRVSTDEQSTQRQTHLLGEAGLADGTEGVRLFADPATSSKIPALERAGFRELARYARPGDRLTVSQLYRLCRDLADILAAREWCRAHGVKLRVLSGLLSSIVDLAATDATTTMLVNVLVSVGQFQRDLQNELTRDGLAAVRAQGVRSGRRPPDSPTRRRRPGPGRVPHREWPTCCPADPSSRYPPAPANPRRQSGSRCPARSPAISTRARVSASPNGKRCRKADRCAAARATACTSPPHPRSTGHSCTPPPRWTARLPPRPTARRTRSTETGWTTCPGEDLRLMLRGAFDAAGPTRRYRRRPRRAGSRGRYGSRVGSGAGAGTHGLHECVLGASDVAGARWTSAAVTRSMVSHWAATPAVPGRSTSTSCAARSMRPVSASPRTTTSRTTTGLTSAVCSVLSMRATSGYGTGRVRQDHGSVPAHGVGSHRLAHAGVGAGNCLDAC
jgi:DNA invertase Pin-like site-specific DNA recombinase